jgi:hypothetical protein
VNVGTNSSVYADVSLNNNDVVTCSVTSNATCATTTTAVSNALNMAVTPVVTPTISVSSSLGLSLCSGVSVTFAATATNGGTSPTYQWKKNGVVVGANSSVYVDAGLLNADVISCVYTSNAACATTNTVTSNALALTVLGSVTPSISISSDVGVSICSGTTAVFTAVSLNGRRMALMLV